jgi:hypothetical protein
MNGSRYFCFGFKTRTLLQRLQVNDNALALDIAELAQAGTQRLNPAGRRGGGTKPQEPDPRDVRRLLRAQR